MEQLLSPDKEKTTPDSFIEILEQDFKSFIDEAFEVLPATHSEVQVLNFMLSKGAYTEYGYLRRCKEELESRCRILEDLSIEWELLKEDEVSQEEKSVVAQKKLKLRKKRLLKSLRNVYQEYSVIKKEFIPLYEKYKDKDLEEEELSYWFEVHKRQVLRTLKFRSLYEVHELLDNLSAIFRHQMMSEIKNFLDSSGKDPNRVKQTLLLLEDKNAQ